MGIIDIVILLLVGIGVIQGLMKGAIRQLASIIGLVAGLLLARTLFGLVAERLAPVLNTSITIAQVISFVLIWVAVPLGCSLIASVLTKAFNAIHLGWLNRLAGALVGALKVLLLIGLAIHVLEYIDPKSEVITKTNKNASTLYIPVRNYSDLFFPMVKGAVDQIIQ